MSDRGRIQAQDVLRLVESFADPSDQAAKKSQELAVQLLQHTPSPFSRDQFTPGHITGTGLVLHPTLEAVLLIHHRRLDRWLLPGGHVEREDASVRDTALREVIEETGAQIRPDKGGLLVGLDVHGIRPNSREPLHYHHDLVFSFRAITPELVKTEEVREARWFQIAKLPEDLPQLQDSIILSIARALRATSL